MESTIDHWFLSVVPDDIIMAVARYCRSCWERLKRWMVVDVRLAPFRRSVKSPRQHIGPGRLDIDAMKGKDSREKYFDTVVYGYKVINAYPHDKKSFTQGLVFHEGALYESVGQHGRSKLRQIDLVTGTVLRQVSVPEQYFAEGIAILNGKIYQITWQDQICFVYDLKSFDKVDELYYEGEGWGLTHDCRYLVMSDGSNRIRFREPSTFETARVIEVCDGDRPLRDLNDVAYVRGEIYANVRYSDYIVRIDPKDGKILGWIDLTGLLPKKKRRHPEAVLNGITYDQTSDRLLVTGKLWPQVFEIQLRPRNVGSDA